MRITRFALIVLVLSLALPVGADVVSVKVTVTTSATVLATASFTEGRKQVEASHACASAIFVGGSDVTTSNGRSIAAGASLSMTLIGGETLYGIYASGTCVTTVLKNGGS